MRRLDVMKYTHWVSWSGLGKNLRVQFLTGILVVVPISATILIVFW